MVDKKKLVASAAILTLGVGTAVIAQGGALSGQEKDSDQSLTGSPARKAAATALRATGGGTVLEVEQGDDPGAAYEVEIRKADGGVTEVLLDGDSNVIGQEADE